MEWKFYMEAIKVENAKRKVDITEKVLVKQYGWLNNRSLTSLSRQQYVSRKNKFDKTSIKEDTPDAISKKLHIIQSGLTIDKL